jgi:hypothetical protein
MALELAKLCYNVPGESIYGELTHNSIKRMTQTLSFLPQKNILVDIGSGSGYMLHDFFMAHNDLILIGFEISTIRASLSRVILKKLFKDKNVNWTIYEQDICELSQLPTGTTHSVSFDTTFTPDLMKKIERIQRNTPTLLYVITNHNTNIYSEVYWTKTAQTIATLKGSHKSKTFYTYWKKNIPK